MAEFGTDIEGWVHAATLASLLVSLGNTVYFASCPYLVRDYDEYTDFIRSGRGSSYMADQLRGYSHRSIRRRAISEVLDHLVESTAGAIAVRDEVLLQVKEYLDTPGAQVPQALFWVTYDIANNLRPWARTIATVASRSSTTVADPRDQLPALRA